jgi:hypothetical protein
MIQLVKLVTLIAFIVGMAVSAQAFWPRHFGGNAVVSNDLTYGGLAVSYNSTSVTYP